MYLSDRDLEFAIKNGQLIVDPPPEEYDTTSIDLHLDSVNEAKIWDAKKYVDSRATDGSDPVLNVGQYKYTDFALKYLVIPPNSSVENKDSLVIRKDNGIILRRGGFVLWQTKEKVGTPGINPQFICFINGKSSSARSGLIVHMTAPTIHAGWYGQITLEIGNLGPFDLSLHEGDAICQIVVAKLTSQPEGKKKEKIAIGQKNVTGQAST